MEIKKIEKVEAGGGHIKTYILGKDNILYSEIYESSNASHFDGFHGNYKVEEHGQEGIIDDFYVINHGDGVHQLGIIIDGKEYKQHYGRKKNGFSGYVW